MIKVKLHIHNENGYMDPRVCVEAEIPAIPRKGEEFWLTETLENELIEMANSSENIASDYRPKWAYSNDTRISFTDVIRVHSVKYTANSEFVNIELTD